MKRLKRIAAFIAASKRKLLTLGFGWSVDRVINITFEWVLYPAVIRDLGLLIGGGTMVLLSILLSRTMIYVYDRTKKDWLGIESIKVLRDIESAGKKARLVGWLMRKSDLLALVVISMISEPVKTTLYLRKTTNQFDGFTRRDWDVFVFSAIVSNASWALTVFGGWKLFDLLGL